MASSITLKSNSYDGRYLQLVCEQTSKSSADNTSTVKWTLSSVGGNENYYSTGPTKVVINGTTVYSSSRVAWDSKTFPASKGSKSGELTITHTSDGTKSINVLLSTAIYTSTVTEKKETWTLDSIPRYATFTTHKVSSKTETSVAIEWGCDASCDAVQYSLNGGSWTTPSGTVFPTYNISGLSANTTYKIKTQVRRKDSQLWTTSGELSVTTYDYPHCTESPNFILGEPVTLKFYNPLKRTFKFYIIGNGIQIDEDYDCLGETSYKGITDPTTSVPYLYATIPNAKSGKYKVKVVYGSSTKTRDNGNTYSIVEKDCLPTFTSNYLLRDTGKKTASITNSQFLIKGYSSLTVEIPKTAQMTAKNGANPKNYTASFNGVNKTIDYSSTATTKCDFGVVNNSGVNSINVIAYDSRTLSTSVRKNITVYDYFEPKIYIDVKRENNFGVKATLKVTGQYETLTVNNVAHNTITYCEYCYREVGTEDWTRWEPLTVTLNNGNFTCGDVVFDETSDKPLENDKSYEFAVQVYDSLTSNAPTKETTVLNAGQGIFFISSNKKQCYVNGKEVSVRQDYEVNGDAVDTNVRERGHVMYKQCFNGHLATDTNNTVIQLPDNAVVRNMYGCIYYTKAGNFFPLNYANPDAPIFTYFNVTNRQIIISTPMNIFWGCEYVVYAEYTIG